MADKMKDKSLFSTIAADFADWIILYDWTKEPTAINEKTEMRWFSPDGNEKLTTKELFETFINEI